VIVRTAFEVFREFPVFRYFAQHFVSVLGMSGGVDPDGDCGKLLWHLIEQ